MSVIGFDIGNESCVIAVAKRGGIDVLLNDESKRETPAVVSFGDKQRFLGSAGAASASANPKSTISQVKRLIGKLYKEQSVQKDLELLPFATTEGPRGGILIELEYLGKQWKFTAVEILGMLFTHLKQISEKNLDQSSVVDCVIGIPSYFTDLQRREYLDAARIAGLRPLRLIHDCTATALGYGMYKTDLPGSGPTNVVFVDIGHCDTQVTVAAFENGKMKILSHSFDQNLGGRDFDEVLFRHFVAQFEKQYKIEISSNARACVRLRAACEKVKKVLSANAEAPISIECLIGDTDVKGIITREEFEKLSSELLKRVKTPCEKAVKESGLNVDKIYTIELVGSGSRIPVIMKTLSSYFKKEPTRTLNASECVARGCALQCAMLSQTVKVQEYQVLDLFPYTIGFSVNGEKYKPLFSKGGSFPISYTISFNRPIKTPVHIEFSYSKKEIPAEISLKVGDFMIGESQSSSAEKVKVILNDNGIIGVEAVTSSEDKRSTRSNGILNYLPRMAASSYTTNISVIENLDVATTKDELGVAKEKEKILAEQDAKVEQVKDQRNTLESFVYDTRSKVSSAYKSFVTDLEKEEITNKLQETEDWLYDEDSDDESQHDYTGKLQLLKQLLDPIEVKYKNDKEEKAKVQAIKALQTCIGEYHSDLKSMAPRFRKHIEKEITDADNWLKCHVLSPKNAAHVILSSDIKRYMESFQKNCEIIKTSKSSIPAQDEHVNPNQREQRVKPKQREQPVKHPNQREQYTNQHPNQREQYTNSQPNQSQQYYTNPHSNQSQQYTNSQPNQSQQYYTNPHSNQSQQYYTNLHPNQSGQYMNQNPNPNQNQGEQYGHKLWEQITDPDQESQYYQKQIDEMRYYESRNPNQRDRSVNMNQMDQQTNVNQRDRSVDFGRGDQTVGSDQKGQPVSSNQGDQSVDLVRGDQPVAPDQRGQPVASDQGDQSVDPGQTVDPDQVDPMQED